MKQKENPEPTAEWGKPPPKPAHQSKESNTGRRAGLDKKFVKALEPSLAHRLQVPGTSHEWLQLQLSYNLIQFKDCYSMSFIG